MGFASDIVNKLKRELEEKRSGKKVGKPKTDELDPRNSFVKVKPNAVIQTENGPMRTKRNGKVDGRQLNRGRPKKEDIKRAIIGTPIHSDEELKRAMSIAEPGDVLFWDWRTRTTRLDFKKANAQRQYAYNQANANGVKVKANSFEEYIEIHVIGRVA